MVEIEIFGSGHTTEFFRTQITTLTIAKMRAISIGMRNKVMAEFVCINGRRSDYEEAATLLILWLVPHRGHYL